jgi:hypothetical protein
MKLFDPIARLFGYPQRIRDLEKQLAILRWGELGELSKKVSVGFVRVNTLGGRLSAHINSTGATLEAHGAAIRTLAEAKIRKPRKK